MDFLKVTGELKKEVEEEIKKFFETELQTIENDVLRDFYKDLRHHTLLGGKRLRPIMCIMAYCGYADYNPNILRVSIAFELLHSSSLILDDAMDEDVLRHGEKTFNAIYADKFLKSTRFDLTPYYDGGNWIKKDGLTQLLLMQRAISRYSYALSVLGSNILYALSGQSIRSSGFDNPIVTKAMIMQREMYKKLNEGQLLDILMEQKGGNEDKYFEMIDHKTGILFTYPLRIGLLLTEKADIHSLDNYSTNLSRAFQVHDDILGVFGDENTTGKPVDSDIKEGKNTLLVIKTLECADENQLKKAKTILGNRNASSEDIAELKDIMKSCGALDYCIEKESQFIKAAKGSIDSEMKESSKEFFNELCDFIIKRKY
ncbi:MAG: Geranylgeranyl diphosphate synthase [Candidatus Methanofastidiosum methylothiophilum]|uniref:Geranylgeranyl diphosphate synthase n=1 Tax=Candidatus Methanofastidiosum methylothiophilum TaxID=1705564 RepID=A0A150ITT0_9EURY|nr:MAG: Geranylgeranyl diphosphate synthase [Candidatus Methanofastidiosum methylthiophilus]KYC48421.1 MAG: Geranylgeranyl diphosphate synthase [Candidatus Methanofastidiosum methylthiophilus]